MAHLGLTPIVENQMDKKMEIEKDTGVLCICIYMGLQVQLPIPISQSSNIEGNPENCQAESCFQVLCQIVFCMACEGLFKRDEYNITK